MAVTSPIMKNEMYYGDISDQQAKIILNIRDTEEVPALKKMIFDFPVRLILESLEKKVSIREILIERGENFDDYVGELRGYQTIGTAFMYMSPRSIIGDGVGTGKTAEISALLNYIKGKGEMTRFIMAVETSALGQTQYELMKFTGLNVVIMPSEAPKMRKMIKNTNWSKVDGIVLKHSALRSDVLSGWLALYLNDDGLSRIFSTFILDESSVIKNRGTKTFQYTENLCTIVNRVHFMNATTFETSIEDIYNQMDMMYPALLPKKWRIEKEYCTFGTKTYWTRDSAGKPKMNYARDMKGYKNQDKFKQSLKLVYFGRSKKEIGKELPHQYLVYEVEPTTEQSLAIAKGHRYMEVLNSPSNIPEINIPFDRLNVPKLDRLITLVDSQFQGDKVMVYCFHLDAQRVLYEELKKLGRTPVILNGKSTDVERLQIIESFNKGSSDVLITNIKKSLNLYAGDVCILYTVETNPSKMEQIRGRIDRSVDEKIKTFVLLVYKGTDEYSFLVNVVRQRAKDARDLTLDSKTAVDFFMEAMEAE